ncbi:hypothetical protein VB713_18935 [Anabaena cylindrica UHCC 0172]|uniref:hypothetical protein n=1 Tax=Anabaena cylindrica TaxID=1165 RepID=UPI002B219BE0|nr:hypothetical protein [Anabaena cylindrica]MEA5553024.1 hypothetical protein [Anabaena cylindrica UHCC 0172]
MKLKQTSQYGAILNRVGIALILAGVLDIAYMVYCVNYSPTLHIPGVVAGVFLLRGNLHTVSIVTWYAAYISSNFISHILILLPFSKPAELWVTEFHLDPVGLFVPYLVSIGAIALFVWIYTQLRAAPVVSARVRSGDSASIPKSAFILGIGLVILMVGIRHFIINGADGAKAVEIARAQYGQNYKYHIKGISWSNQNVSAQLTAYNEQEIKPIQVEWKQ